jgi:hypothetical protein
MRGNEEMRYDKMSLGAVGMLAEMGNSPFIKMIGKESELTKALKKSAW